MSLKRKEYKVDDHMKKAALFFLACEANPDTRLTLVLLLFAAIHSLVILHHPSLFLNVKAASGGAFPQRLGIAVPWPL
jgi:hypothetical protein